jgi:hypothetical protein
MVLRSIEEGFVASQTPLGMTGLVVIVMNGSTPFVPKGEPFVAQSERVGHP